MGCPRTGHRAAWRQCCNLISLLSITTGASAAAWQVPRDNVCIAPVVPPDARSEAEASHRDAIDALLWRLWRGRSGYGIDGVESSAIAQAVSASVSEDCSDRNSEIVAEASRVSTYGEITSLGARQLGRAISLDRLNLSSKIVDGDVGGFVFADLGCGVGKLVVQSYLEWPAVVAAVGIELSTSRVSHARSAWKAALKSGEAQQLRASALGLLEEPRQSTVEEVEHSVTFIEGDILKASLRDVTHIYMASLCFGRDLLGRLARNLAVDTPRLLFVASLRRLPDGLEGFDEIQPVEAEMTWNAPGGQLATIHLYRRRVDSNQP